MLSSLGLGSLSFLFLGSLSLFLQNSVLLAQFLGQLHLGILQLLSLLGQIVMLRSQSQNCGLCGLEVTAVGLVVKSHNRSKLFVNERVVALLFLAGLHSFDNPLLELELLGVVGAVESKLEVVFSLPEIFRVQSLSLALLERQVILVLIVISRDVGGKSSGVTVLVKQKLREIAVLERELEAD